MEKLKSSTSPSMELTEQYDPVFEVKLASLVKREAYLSISKALHNQPLGQPASTFGEPTSTFLYHIPARFLVWMVILI